MREVRIVGIPCPFVYADGKRCTGEIKRIEVYKADITWSRRPDGAWELEWDPRSHYHLFCSEKGTHSGWAKRDDSRMKFYLSELPAAVRAVLAACSEPMVVEPNG
ncbi:MAG: hypothetical protein PVH41_01925 [Anaerolineae bacterium]